MLPADRIALQQLLTIQQQLLTDAAATRLLTNQLKTALGSARAAASADVLWHLKWRSAWSQDTR